MSAPVARAVMLRLRELRLAIGMLVLAILGAGLADASLDARRSLSPGAMAICGFLLALTTFDTTRMSGHLDLVDRFPVSRARAWAIDLLAAAFGLLAMLCGAALASGAAWRSLAGACIVAFGLGAAVSALTRSAWLQLALACLTGFGGARLAFDAFASWGMDPTLSNLALPSALAGSVLVAASLALRCLAPSGVRRRRQAWVHALIVGGSAVLIVGVGRGAIHSWEKLPPRPDSYSVAQLGEASDGALLLEVMTRLGTHVVSARLDRPGEWVDLGRRIERLARDPADPSRWLHRTWHAPTWHSPATPWLAAGDAEGRHLELLLPLEEPARRRVIHRRVTSWSGDGAWLAIAEWEEAPPMDEVLERRIVILDRKARRVHEIPAEGMTVTEWIEGGLEAGPVGEGSLPDLVIDLVHDPATQREIRIERPRRWLVHPEGSALWLFERVTTRGDVACTSLVLRDALAGTERIVLDQAIPCMPAEAAPQIPPHQDFPWLGGLWFQLGGSHWRLRPTLVADARQRRVVALVPRVEGDSIVSQMIAIDLESGTRRLLLGESALPRAIMASEQVAPSLVALTDDGSVVWRHPAGVDVTDGSAGVTRVLARWPLGTEPEMQSSPSGRTLVTRMREERYVHRIDAWQDGASRLLWRSRGYPAWSFIDDERLFVASGDRALLVPLDGSPPQALFP